MTFFGTLQCNECMNYLKGTQMFTVLHTQVGPGVDFNTTNMHHYMMSTPPPYQS